MLEFIKALSLEERYEVIHTFKAWTEDRLPYRNSTSFVAFLMLYLNAKSSKQKEDKNDGIKNTTIYENLNDNEED